MHAQEQRGDLISAAFLDGGHTTAVILKTQVYAVSRLLPLHVQRILKVCNMFIAGSQNKLIDQLQQTLFVLMNYFVTYLFV